MSKQMKASRFWQYNTLVVNIERLQAQATNYSYPAGQAQAGIQLATVAVPRLLEEIERLKGQINEHRAVA